MGRKVIASLGTEIPECLRPTVHIVAQCIISFPPSFSVNETNDFRVERVG